MLQIRNQLNQEQNSKLQQQKDLLNKRNMEVAMMDKRIGELRERLYGKKIQARGKARVSVRLGLSQRAHLPSEGLVSVCPDVQHKLAINREKGLQGVLFPRRHLLPGACIHPPPLCGSLLHWGARARVAAQGWVPATMFSCATGPSSVTLCGLVSLQETGLSHLPQESS